MFAGFYPFIQFITQLLSTIILGIGALALVGPFSNVNLLGIGLSVGVLSAFVVYLGQFYSPFVLFSQVQNIVNLTMTAADRVYSFLKEDLDVKDPENPTEIVNISGNIHFEDVNFGYNSPPGSIPSTEFTSESLPSKDHGMLAKTLPKEILAKLQPSEMLAKMLPKEILAKLQPSEMLAKMLPGIQRTISIVAALPEAYKQFLSQNLPKLPPDISMKIMMELQATNSSEIPAKIDVLLANYGYAVPNAEFSREHPELKTEFKQDERTSAFPPPPTGKTIASQVAAKNEFINNVPIDFKFLTALVRNLEKLLEKGTNTSSPSLLSGIGSGGGGIIGNSNSGGSTGPVHQMLRNLAEMPIPDEVLNDFPEIVRKAIDEERLRISHERTVGIILDYINLQIDAGKNIAIVGETGVGKSTLIKLIVRFYDVNSGSIKLDGIDIRTVLKKTLWKRISIVPQESFLFTDTISRKSPL